MYIMAFLLMKKNINAFKKFKYYKYLFNLKMKFI